MGGLSPLLAACSADRVRERIGADSAFCAPTPALSPGGFHADEFSGPAVDPNRRHRVAPPDRAHFRDSYRISVRILFDIHRLTGWYLRDSHLISDSFRLTQKYPLAIG